MGTVSYSAIENLVDKNLYTWSGLSTTNDTGEACRYIGSGKRSMQVSGTFGVDGAVVIEGSIDGTNWATMATLTQAAVVNVASYVVAVRPRVSSGDGTTNINASLSVVRGGYFDDKLDRSGDTIGAYYETGATLVPVDGVLTIPLDGKHYSCTPNADITSITLSSVPSSPVVGAATVYFNYSSAVRAIASPTTWYWPDKLRTLTATKSGYIVRLDVWSTPAGNIVASVTDFGVPA